MFNDNYYKLLEAYYMQINWSSMDTSIVAYDGSVITDRPISSLSSSQLFGMQFNAAGNPQLPGIRQISNNTTYYYNNSSSTSNAAYTGVILGDGDTPPAVTDYKLSGNQITTFSASTSLTAGYSDGKLTFAASYSITNTGVDDIVIKELAITKKAYNTNNRVMVAREVLATPVIIAPGDTGVVNYKIEIS